ncbi:MAG: hypothetical protein LBI67_05825 [Treponema sp.]|nr:hypothetical protein [Treponema sp.]
MKNQIVFIFCVIVYFLTPSIANAKEPIAEKENPFRIGLSLGYTFAGYKETTYDPLNRRLSNLTFLLDANIAKGNFLHSLNAGYYQGKADTDPPGKAVLNTTYDPVTGQPIYYAYYPAYTAHRAYLEYSLDHRLWGNQVLPGYLGGAFRADAYLQFAHYPSITGILSLDLHATQKWIINHENNLQISLSIPLIGYTVRPAYAGADEALIKYSAEEPLRLITLGNFASLHNYWAVFGDIKYNHKINNLLNMYAGLGFELSHINVPKQRRDASLRLSSGIAFTF